MRLSTQWHTPRSPTSARTQWPLSRPYHQSSCEEYKPRDKWLDRQGVEILQVISRCRCNYQQSRWDEASSLPVGAEERGYRGTTSSRTTTGEAPELSPPQSAYAVDAVFRTSTRGTVPMGQ